MKTNKNEQLEKKTDLEYWDNQHKDFVPYQVERPDFAFIVDKILPINPDFKCVEIGAYPGRYLCYLAKKFKYFPYAIEYSEHCNHISQLLEFNGISDYEVINKDFFEVKDLQVDVVSSFGFIEHFTDYDKVIKAHFDLLKPGGYLVIGVPYWGGLRNAIRMLVCTEEKKESILSIHNTEIMRLDKLKNSIAKNPCKIVYSGYYGGTALHFNWKQPFVKPQMRFLVFIVNVFNKIFGKILPSSKFYSPSIIVVAQKNEMLEK